jgi:CHASE2 domain-containing sensor protein
LVLLIPVLAALTSFSARIEPLFYDPMLVAIHGALPADNTAIVAFAPQRDARALRPSHPGMIDTLVAAGAKAIFFDVIMGAETVHDEAISQAIVRAAAAGVPVILPLMSENQSVLFPASSALRDSARFGVVLAQTDTTFWHVRRAPMRTRELSGEEHWHAAAQTVRAHLGAEDLPQIEDGELVIGPNRNPVWADLAYLHPVEATPVLAYDLEGDFSAVRGRSVLIGELGGADDVHRTGRGAVYGVEIEAMMVETLLQQRAPQIASPEINALWALIVGTFTALLGLAVPRTRRRIALAVPVVGMGVGIILVGAGLLVAFVPMLLASFIGLWIVRAQKSETMGRSHP